MSATLCTWIKSILSRPSILNDVSTCSRACAGPRDVELRRPEDSVAYGEIVDGFRGRFLGCAIARRRVEHGAALLEHRHEHGFDRFHVVGAGDLAERRRAAEPDDRQLFAGLRNLPRQD